MNLGRIRTIGYVLLVAAVVFVVLMGGFVAGVVLGALLGLMLELALYLLKLRGNDEAGNLYGGS